jgi:hypothetical protein
MVWIIRHRDGTLPCRTPAAASWPPDGGAGQRRRLSAGPGPLVVMAPEDGRSAWRPVPANGFIRHIRGQATTRVERPPGYETVIPVAACGSTGRIRTGGPLRPGRRPHAAPDGTGHLLLLRPPPAARLLQHRRPAADPPWLMLPGRLEAIFACMRRPHLLGEPAPASLPRSTDVSLLQGKRCSGVCRLATAAGVGNAR